MLELDVPIDEIETMSQFVNWNNEQKQWVSLLGIFQCLVSLFVW